MTSYHQLLRAPYKVLDHPHLPRSWVKESRARKALPLRLQRYGVLMSALGIGPPPIAGDPTPASWQARMQRQLIGGVDLSYPNMPLSEVAADLALPYQWVLAHIRRAQVPLSLYRLALLCERTGTPLLAILCERTPSPQESHA